MAYTLGKVEDTVPDATAVVPEGADDRKFASNPADFDADRAPGGTDQRHRFVGSVIYTTDTFASRFGGWVEDVLKDWTLSAIYTVQSGQPYSAYVATDINRDFNRFNDVAPGTTRNEFRFPTQMSFDPRVARNIGIGGTRELTLIWEAFNLLNRANYNVVNNTLYTVDQRSDVDDEPAVRAAHGAGRPEDHAAGGEVCLLKASGLRAGPQGSGPMPTGRLRA